MVVRVVVTGMRCVRDGSTGGGTDRDQQRRYIVETGRKVERKPAESLGRKKRVRNGMKVESLFFVEMVTVLMVMAVMVMARRTAMVLLIVI